MPSGDVPRLKLPGFGAHEHVYCRRSPRLIPMLAKDDPVQKAAMLLDAQGVLGPKIRMKAPALEDV